MITLDRSKYPNFTSIMKDYGVMVTVGAQTYFYFPYWIKDGDTGQTIELYGLNEVPEDLKKVIEEQRNASIQIDHPLRQYPPTE